MKKCKHQFGLDFICKKCLVSMHDIKPETVYLEVTADASIPELKSYIEGDTLYIENMGIGDQVPVPKGVKRCVVKNGRLGSNIDIGIVGGLNANEA